MADPELVKRWIQKADEDFGYAALSLEEGFTFFPQICWHFQQAAEKYLKAYIVAFDLEFRKIHDLSALLHICEKHNPSFSALLEECTYLQKYYVEARYPVMWEISCSKDETHRARQAIQNIIDFVKKALA
jgi:HEPN domain-containing protein